MDANALTKSDGSNLPALPDDLRAEAEKLVEENLAEGGFDIPRIEIVHSAQVFKFPDETTCAKFQGVLLLEHGYNVYYSKKPGDEGSGEVVPPDCVANDGVNGSRPMETVEVTKPNGNIVAEPIYGKCVECWYNRFGSEPIRGKGKACANRTRTLVWPLNREARTPYLILVPPGSMKIQGRSLAYQEIKNHTIKAGGSPPGCVAEFYLEKKQAGAQVYSVFHARVVGSLELGQMDADTFRAVVEFRKMFGPAITGLPLQEQQATELADPEAEEVKPDYDTGKDLPF